ncbi:MAG: hypothetical protein QF546_15115 [Alphaproteobacteria bacterium]|jgi:hypothetical protein|nr:hypothetical protein [Alphaproteobacteria bacterium]HJP21775.1 hypothetical protein [Alphaproteobacteria bacterium]
MRCLLFVVLLVVGWSTPSLATFENGKQAYDRGDFAAAFRIWQAAARAGDARAQTNLGVLYALGRGVKPDAKVAVSWYRRAAAQDYAKGQYNLGLALRAGKGIGKDEAKAVALFRQAAEQGLASAQYMLGLSLLRGRGVARNQAEALQWYRRAALSGYARAQYALGRLHAKGQVVPKDTAKAVSWYRRAAESNLGTAQVRLGLAYLRGEGVASDPVQAFIWLARGAKRTRGKVAQTAKRQFAELTDRMTAEQLVQAQALLAPGTEVGSGKAAGADLARHAGCLRCHGSAGIDHPFIPVIAGQRQRYLENQLLLLRLPPEATSPEFAAASRHDHVMGPLVKSLSRRDIGALAKFFSEQRCGGGEGAAAEGPATAKRCTECHGAAGISDDVAVPNLAGQKGPYLVRQLRLLRDSRAPMPLAETGGSRHYAKMHRRVTDFNDDQIRVLGRHYAGLPCR